MNLEIKGVAASPKGEPPLSARKKKLGQQWKPRSKSTHGPRPAEVPCLDLGKLGDSEDEDGDFCSPYSNRHSHIGPPYSSSTAGWGNPLQSPSAQHYDIQQTARITGQKKNELSLWEQNIVPENLPLPADSYRLKYQQYEAEMKEGYKQYSQRATEKKANSHSHVLPVKITEQKDLQPENHMVGELTALDEKAQLQQGYMNKPYVMKQSLRKLEAEDVVAERKTQTVVEQIMLDQLCRAVISDPEQNGNTGSYEKDPSLPGLRTAPLRFRRRTLHETKIVTRSALTEHMLSNKLRFDGRLISRNGRDACRELIGFFFACDKSLTVYEYRLFGKNRTNALPFIQKGIYEHQRGQRKGKQYSLNDFCVGANLTFLSLHHPGLPESIKQKPVFTIRVTNIDETAKAFLKVIGTETEEHCFKQGDDVKRIFQNVQDKLKEKLSKRGIRIMTGLGKYFRELEKNQNGILTKANFKHSLKVFHLEVPEEDFESLWLILNDHNDGIDYFEFTRAILGEMNEYRKAFVRKAYMKLDYNRTGSVPMVDIQKCYCARRHPQVLSGSEEDIKPFLETLVNVCINPNEVLFCEFEDYYEGLSIGMIDDEEFVNILRNSWGI
ncbi:calcyphosin-2 isoform X1 [Sphaerodactylus townsendi]|uniref:calcyphosin-2 isoform X1 n=1 Tax=Sphaerodactylus townsendi TaxID=933632 RepID=UPI002027295F|nr:calcyphosin-2 isoform X1 [Sphaerodactylus townsendi]XP_048357898.1 calcyphosin-2 isoform X1 [Sphaerodactylus townsendi]XP_048357899.1 calcyphosin-2 isoform X1 [Sphaerodactylus townsendi]